MTQNIILWSFDPFLYDHIDTIEKAKTLINSEDIKIAIWDTRDRESIFDINHRVEIIKSYWFESKDILIIRNKEELRDALRSSNNIVKAVKNFDKKLMENIWKEFGISRRLAKNLHFMNIPRYSKVSSKKILKAIYTGSSYNAVKDYINEFTYNEIRKKIKESK